MCQSNKDNNNNKRKFNSLRRTDNDEDYLGSTSSINNFDLAIQHDIDEEIDRLNRQISCLYQQIKNKKERIEAIKINCAVKKARKETEERIRRESNKWLPTLDKVTEIQQNIIKNLSSESDSDNDDEDFTITGFIDFCKENDKNLNNK